MQGLHSHGLVLAFSWHNSCRSDFRPFLISNISSPAPTFSKFEAWCSNLTPEGIGSKHLKRQILTLDVKIWCWTSIWRFLTSNINFWRPTSNLASIFDVQHQYLMLNIKYLMLDVKYLMLHIKYLMPDVKYWQGTSNIDAGRQKPSNWRPTSKFDALCQYLTLQMLHTSTSKSFESYKWTLICGFSAFFKVIYMTFLFS